MDPLAQLLVASLAAVAVAGLPFLWSRGERPAWKVWWVLFWSSVLLIGAKTADLLEWKLAGLAGLEGLTRQSILAVTVGLLTALCLGSKRVLTSFLPLTGLWPTGLRLQSIARSAWGRLGLGVVAILGPVIALGLPKGDTCRTLRGSSCWSSIGWLALGLGAFAALAGWEIVRSRRYRQDPMRREEPRHDLLWTVMVPSVLLTIVAAASLLLGRPDEGSPVGKLRDLAVVTAFGEELLFRGFLLAMALIATSPRRVEGVRDRTVLGYWVVSISFGLWHLGDALEDVRNDWSWVAAMLVVTGTMLTTTIASRFVLIPLRVRTRSLAAPVLAHFSANAPGIVLRP